MGGRNGPDEEPKVPNIYTPRFDICYAVPMKQR